MKQKKEGKGTSFLVLKRAGRGTSVEGNYSTSHVQMEHCQCCCPFIFSLFLQPERNYYKYITKKKRKSLLLQGSLKGVVARKSPATDLKASGTLGTSVHWKESTFIQHSPTAC